jgi:hypothetical protein
MPRFRHTLAIAAVERAWFERLVLLTHDAAKEVLGSAGYPLTEGEALAPGATYAAPEGPTNLALTSWDPDGASAGVLEVAGEDLTTTWTGELHGVHEPRTATLVNEVRAGTAAAGLAASVVETRADFDAWWAAAEGTVDGAAPLTGVARYRVFELAYELTPTPGADGMLDLTIAVDLRGHGFARIVLALALPVRNRLWRRYVGELDGVAAKWNAEVPRLRELPEDELRALVVARVRAVLLGAGRAGAQSSRKP